MKNALIFFLLALMSVNLCKAQEWMTSLDVAKRLAFVQDKLILMVWEDAAIKHMPFLIKREGTYGFVNLFDNDYIDGLFWKNFVPVIVSENRYEELYKEIAKTKNDRYIDMFNSNDIKILDVNGKILGSQLLDVGYFNLERFLYKYGLNTSFLKTDLKNYRNQKNFYTSFRLASKYLDYSILVNDLVRNEVTELSGIYLKEASEYLLISDLESKEVFMQKIALLKLKNLLIINKPKKVLRKLKPYRKMDIKAMNESLLAFLYYTSYKLTKEETKADLWKTKVSLLDLKYANLILNINS